MPSVKSNYIGKLLLTLVVVALLIGFTPISKKLLHYVDGSFSPTSFSSLALSTPSSAAVGIAAGSTVPVELTNRTGRTTTYHWTATQNGTLLSSGGRTLTNGSSTTLSITTRGAVAGSLRISLSGTKIFVTIPLRASRP
jgi:hypothetical protein